MNYKESEVDIEKTEVIHTYAEAVRTLKEYDLKPIEFEIKPPSKLQGKYKGFEFDTDCDYSERGYATFLILKCPKEKVLDFDHKSHWLAGYDFDFSDENLHDNQTIFDFHFDAGCRGRNFVFLEKFPTPYSEVKIKYLS